MMDFCELIEDTRLSEHDKATLIRRGIVPSVLRGIWEMRGRVGLPCFDMEGYVSVVSQLDWRVLSGSDFCSLREQVVRLNRACVIYSISRGRVEDPQEEGEIEMTCILNESKSTIVKEGKMWVVDGKYRVKKLSECQIVTEEGEAIGEAPEAPEAAAPVPAPVPAPKVVAEVGVAPHAPPPSALSENQELLEILKLVGGNVWLGFLVVAYVLGKKYLDKMDLAQSSQAKMKDEIGKQMGETNTKLSETNTKLEGLSTRLEGLFVGKIEQTKTDLTNSVRDTKTEMVKEIESAKKESKSSLDAIEKRVIALEMEVKYAGKATAAPRGKKAAATTDDE